MNGTRSTIGAASFPLFLLLFVAPRMVAAQGDPLGEEFRVNSYTTNSQSFPSMAADAAGNFVIAWSSDTQDGDARGVFAQRYASSGAPLGGEFRVNTYTTNSQDFPSVASDSIGNFVVAWHSDAQDGSARGIFAQRYASTGAPLGGEFRVNSYTTTDQKDPRVASDAAGNFVIVWNSGTQDGSGRGIFGQRYTSTGTPLGGEFRVNSYTTGDQFLPAIASDSAGNFVVAWSSYPQDSLVTGVFAQRYASTGAPLGGEFRVNSDTALDQYLPSVASDATGNFVVAWTGWDLSEKGAFAHRYANTGAPLGGEFRVNTYTTFSQHLPSVAADSAGNFVVTWHSNTQDGSGDGIFAQRYASTGSPLGGEFRVNSYTTSNQSLPSVVSDSAGNFVVAWESGGQDGSGDGVFAQRFSMIVPVELQSFGVE